MTTWNDILHLSQEGNVAPAKRITRSNEQWRQQLSNDQFHITRQKGTERAFSSGSCNLFEPGAYSCVCCSEPLFDASEKFDSGSGWPSFTTPVNTQAIAYTNDGEFGMDRIEVTCNCCDAHLGHVFPDGPAPSGLRYCINAVSLRKTS